jgi:hypothetical protein
MSDAHPSLPTNRAFVVQFRPPADGATPTYAGRVEHVVSGEVRRFHSLEELLEFMVGMLGRVPHDAEGGPPWATDTPVERHI